MTFSARESVARGQRVRYVTERAVFDLTARGLRLLEVAPGVDVRRDVLDLIPFDVLVEDVRTMEPGYFQ